MPDSKPRRPRIGAAAIVLILFGCVHLAGCSVFSAGSDVDGFEGSDSTASHLSDDVTSAVLSRVEASADDDEDSPSVTNANESAIAAGSITDETVATDAFGDPLAAPALDSVELSPSHAHDATIGALARGDDSSTTDEIDFVADASGDGRNFGEDSIIPTGADPIVDLRRDRAFAVAAVSSTSDPLADLSESPETYSSPSPLDVTHVATVGALASTLFAAAEFDDQLDYPSVRLADAPATPPALRAPVRLANFSIEDPLAESADESAPASTFHQSDLAQDVTLGALAFSKIEHSRAWPVEDVTGQIPIQLAARDTSVPLANLADYTTDVPEPTAAVPDRPAESTVRTVATREVASVPQRQTPTRTARTRGSKTKSHLNKFSTAANERLRPTDQSAPATATAIATTTANVPRVAHAENSAPPVARIAADGPVMHGASRMIASTARPGPSQVLKVMLVLSFLALGFSVKLLVDAYH